MDAAGNALIVWGKEDIFFGFTGLFYARFAPGTGWGEAQRIQGMALLPGEIALHPDGRGIALLVERSRTPSRSALWSLTLDPEAGWGATQLLEGEGTSDAHTPDLAPREEGPMASG